MGRLWYRPPMESFAPQPDERICIVTFEVARIRLGGGPQDRPSFWRVYRDELALNRKTEYKNEHVRICCPMLEPVLKHFGAPVFYRGGKLILERAVGQPSALPGT